MWQAWDNVEVECKELCKSLRFHGKCDQEVAVCVAGVGQCGSLKVSN